MGSKKYPDVNAFDSYIKQHGGEDNASTDCEWTIFQACIMHWPPSITAPRRPSPHPSRRSRPTHPHPQFDVQDGHFESLP
jgi:hypothetical protein